MDSSPLTRKFADGHEPVIQGQGCFTKCGLLLLLLLLLFLFLCASRELVHLA